MRISLLLLTCLMFFISTYSQKTDIQKQFESLQLNSSPAYVLLGVDPENIQRPNSPTDFKANIQSAVVNGILQPNFALETSPYYWGKPKNKPNKFNPLDHIVNNNFGTNLAKSITFSLATSPSDTFTFGSIKKGTGYGIGMTMQLFHGGVSKNVKTNLFEWFMDSRGGLLLDEMKGFIEDDNSHKIDDLNEWLQDKMEEVRKDSAFITPALGELLINELMKEIGKSTLTIDDVAMLGRKITKFDSKARKSINKVNEYKFPLTREGFILELAIANAGVAENNEWGKMNNAKTAIWLTPSYRFNVNKDPTVIDFIDLLAVFRLTVNNKKIDSSNYFDGGMKFQWIHDKLSFSAEGVVRYLTKKPDNQKKNYTLRTDFTFSYKINDLITFKATFGSNFDGTSVHYSDPKKMFAVGGFNFGFSNLLKSKQ